ncbi:MAG: DUF4868 domain-containing protein [Fimbriimonadaceae bacterium]|nr:DUF4868 domain-containing protein [Fimbriimonadaceae bacterium]
MNPEVDKVEFCCAVDDGNELSHYQVPVNAEVQGMLKDMLDATFTRLGNVDAIPDYDPSDKYGQGEHASIPYDDDLAVQARAIYEAANITVNSGVLDQVDDIDYYYARFYSDEDVVAVGVKRATQFKVLQGKRLVFFSDTLQTFDKHVFKLDAEFDYIIRKPKILVSNVFGFTQTAEIDDAIQAQAVASSAAMFGAVNFLDATALSLIAEEKKSAARYFASIKKRGGVQNLQKPLVEAHCAKFGIDLVEENGKLRPAQGSELKFLKLLDRRLLETQLTDEEELFEASSRSPYVGEGG